MGDLIGYGLVYKSGLAFFLTAITKKLAIYSTVQYSTPVLNICKFLTLVLTWSQTCDICPSCVFVSIGLVQWFGVVVDILFFYGLVPCGC